MRWSMVLGVLMLASLTATPAAARWTLPRPSACDRPIPTGRPVPRQAIIDAVGDVLMQGTESPTWRDRPIGLAGRGERVTILQECGMKLRIRNVRGLEGWIFTVAISDERKAYDAAAHRTPETIADCEMLYIDPVTVDRCKIKLQAQLDHQDEVKNSPYMSAEELRRFIVGRQLAFVARFVSPSAKIKPYLSYYAPNGEYFVMQGPPQEHGFRHRGRYELVGDSICFPHEGPFCPRLRKVGDGLVWALQDGSEFTITGTNSDGADIIAAVSKWLPQPVDPAPPKGSEDVAGPRL